MADAASYPIPIGTTASFARVVANLATSTFFLDEGYTIVTFQPVDVSNPGAATLYDSGNTAIVVLNAAGYGELTVPPGGASGYYFKATLGANILAATSPNMLR